MNETTTLTPVDVYDSTRLPHYGAIDYDEGSETVHLDGTALRAYQAACEAWQATADDDGYLDESTRIDYAVEVEATMTTAAGETYIRDDLALVPGDLRWRNICGAAERCARG